MINTATAESKNGVMPRPVLYGNIFSQLLMKYHATGNAIKHDKPTNATKFLVTSGTICDVFAPITLRMLISFCLCSVVNAMRPSRPRHVIIIVSMENAVNILPRFSSAAYCELKSWSKKVYANGNSGKYFFHDFSTDATDVLIFFASSFNAIMLLVGL